MPASWKIIRLLTLGFAGICFAISGLTLASIGAPDGWSFFNAIIMVGRYETTPISHLLLHAAVSFLFGYSSFLASAQIAQIFSDMNNWNYSVKNFRRIAALMITVQVIRFVQLQVPIEQTVLRELPADSVATIHISVDNIFGLVTAFMFFIAIILFKRAHDTEKELKSIV